MNDDNQPSSFSIHSLRRQHRPCSLGLLCPIQLTCPNTPNSPNTKHQCALLQTFRLLNPQFHTWRLGPKSRMVPRSRCKKKKLQSHAAASPSEPSSFTSHHTYPEGKEKRGEWATSMKATKEDRFEKMHKKRRHFHPSPRATAIYCRTWCLFARRQPSVATDKEADRGRSHGAELVGPQSREARDHSPLQDRFQRRRTPFPARRQFVHDRDQVRKAIAALVGQDPRHGDIVHLGIELMEFHKARGVVFPSQAPQCIFDDIADDRLHPCMVIRHGPRHLLGKQGGGEKHLPRHHRSTPRRWCPPGPSPRRPGIRPDPRRPGCRTSAGWDCGVSFGARSSSSTAPPGGSLATCAWNHPRHPRTHCFSPAWSSGRRICFDPAREAIGCRRGLGASGGSFVSGPSQRSARRRWHPWGRYWRWNGRCWGCGRRPNSWLARRSAWVRRRRGMANGAWGSRCRRTRAKRLRVGCSEICCGRCATHWTRLGRNWPCSLVLGAGSGNNITRMVSPSDSHGRVSASDV